MKARTEAGQDLVAIGLGEYREFVRRLFRTQYLDERAGLGLVFGHGADVQSQNAVLRIEYDPVE